MTLLVQILGGILGIGIACLLDYVFTQRSARIESEYKIQQQKELEEYKKSLIKHPLGTK
jgi:hypothetical protein